MNINLYKLLYKIDTSFDKTGRFIDLETFIKNEDDASFIKMTVKPRLPFLKIPEKLKRFVIALYMIESEEFKKPYDWIYNPPNFNTGGATTIGSIERTNFATHYGGYMELVYICASFENTSPRNVFEWDTSYFLFWAEYLRRKRIVENLK